jgi:hypothetical protein
VKRNQDKLAEAQANPNVQVDVVKLNVSKYPLLPVVLNEMNSSLGST